MEHGAKWNISQVCGRTMVSNDAVGKHGKRMRVIAEKHPPSCDSNTPTTVRMIHEHQLTLVRMSLFRRREFPNLGSKWFIRNNGGLSHHS
jgi:hypothetical protein